MYRVLEVFFRHPFRVLLMFIMAPAIAIGITYFVAPHTYQAAASLWAYERYTVITAYGTDSNLYVTPAQTQATALTELLHSRSFVLSVVTGINIAPTLNISSSAASNPQTRGDDIFADISKNAVVTPLDYSLYTITYTNTDSRVAQQVVAAIVKQFGIQGVQFTYAQAQRLLQVYQSQLGQARQQANSAVLAEQQYLSGHPELTRPGISPLNDPQYAALDQQRLQDQYSVQSIQTSVGTLNQEINAQGTNSVSLFKEIDPPLVPGLPLSRTKQFLVDGGIGLAIGLIACIVYMLIMVRRDRAIYISRDLEKFAAMPVLMQLPHLKSAEVGLFLELSS